MSTRPPRGRQKQRKDTLPTLPPLKVVIRRLPPNLPENIFHTSIATWHKGIDWSEYVIGKVSGSRTKSDTFSRAYIKFRKHSDVTDFIKRYHGHLFVSGEGKEFRACAEIAPFQRIPKPVSNAVKAKDNLCNTLQQDPEFLAFEESLKSTTPHKKEETVVQNKITPLIEHLRAQKLKNEAKAKARKAKEALTKGKQQEEKKKKTMQAQSEAPAIKAREKSTANGKGTRAKQKVDPTPVADSAPATQTSKKHGKANRTKQSEVAKASAPVKADTPSSIKDRIPDKRPAQIPQVTKPSSLAQQRLAAGPKSQGPTTRANETRPTETRSVEQSKTIKPKKSKKKEGPKKPNGKDVKQGQTKSFPVDISGPTPAEMAALAKGKV